MKTYYLHDGHNELGPFTIDDLRKIKLTRNTPIREDGSDLWRPAEKIAALQDKVMPRKIRMNKDFVPAVLENVNDLRHRKPVTLYSSLLAVGLLAGLSIYSISVNAKRLEIKEPTTTTIVHKKQPAQQQQLKVEPVTEIISEEMPPKAKPAKLEVINSKPAKVKPDKAKLSRKNWQKLITATNSNYGIGVLGGIKGLKVIVTNKSVFPVDQIVVKVTYLKANGKDLKNMFVTISDIPAKDQKELELKDAGRGKKVVVSIEKLVSKKMMFSYNAGASMKNPDDPYFTGASVL